MRPTGFRVNRNFVKGFIKVLKKIIVLDRPFVGNRSQNREEAVASLFCSGNEFVEYGKLAVLFQFNEFPGFRSSGNCFHQFEVLAVS